MVGILVLALARPTPRTLAVAFVLALVGEAIRIWASGHIDKTRALATGGPYAHSRNPLYVGSLVLAGGIAAGSASPWVVGAVALYFLAFYPAVMAEESAFLRQRFGEAYVQWAEAVPLFVPRLTPGGPRVTAFSWERVRANREWRTALAVPAVLLLLFARGLIGQG